MGDKAIYAIIKRLENSTGPSNVLDMAIDIALFKPDRRYASVKPNAAGTKLVYTRHDGTTETYWAQDHTLNDARRNMALQMLLVAAAGATP